MLQRIVLVIATLITGALFVSGPLRMAAPQGMPIADYWGMSPYASHVAVFGVFGLFPAVAALALMLAAARQRRLGESDDASALEGGAKVFVAVLVLLQLFMIPYHELRLTGVHQLGTVTKVGTRIERSQKSSDVTVAYIDVDTTLPSGKTIRTNPRITDEEAKRVKVGDRIDTFSTSEVSYVGTGATLPDGKAGLASVLVFAPFVVLVQELFRRIRKGRTGQPTTPE